MKRLITILCLIPFALYSQSFKEKRQADKALRESADTINFPKPFEFTFIDTVDIPKAQIYTKCFQYLATKVSNLNFGNQMHDSLSGKIVVPNMTSNYNEDYRYTLTIDVREGKYRCRFENFYCINYLNFGKTSFDTIAELKFMYLGPGTKHQHWQVEKYHEREEAIQIFNDLKAYVGKRDDF